MRGRRGRPRAAERARANDWYADSRDRRESCPVLSFLEIELLKLLQPVLSIELPKLLNLVLFI